ncbi:MAG: Ig-like domain-containing protein [Prevotellaceae bacterium]|jgi:uncharacterized protein YjdB|nr:Ig-like domain-containing protein [Prevotellaceae bacterium]
MKRIFLFLAAGLACATGMVSCGEDDKEPGNVPLTGITVDREDISENIRYGAVVVSNVVVLPVPANATDVNFKWESQDPSVATAVEDGLGIGKITVLKEGATVVTVRSGSVSAQIPVEGYISVTPLEEIRWSVTLNGELVSQSSLAPGDSLPLPLNEPVTVNATPYPVNANTATADSVTLVWKSSKESVATVDQTGKITVISADTATIITISCEEYKGISASIPVKGVAAGGS